MHPNPNKFLTVVFSFIPGAGHMYLGLMKRGISFMAAFFACCLGVFAAESFLRISVLTALFGVCVPLVWFVSFFDFWRYPRMGAEEKSALKDDFLMIDQLTIPKGPLLRKIQIVAGFVLIFGGLSQLYTRLFADLLVNYWRSHPLISDLVWQLPRLGGAVLIIIVGLLLIFWKGRQIKQAAKEEAYDEE